MNYSGLPNFMKRGVGLFSSEKVIVIHILNFCGIKKINTKIRLMNNRKNFNYL